MTTDCTGPALFRTGTVVVLPVTRPDYAGITAALRTATRPIGLRSTLLARPATGRLRRTWTGQQLQPATGRSKYNTQVSISVWPTAAPGDPALREPARWKGWMGNAPSSRSKCVPVVTHAAVNSRKNIQGSLSTILSTSDYWKGTCISRMARSTKKSMSTVPSCKAKWPGLEWSAAIATIRIATR